MPKSEVMYKLQPAAKVLFMDSFANFLVASMSMMVLQIVGPPLTMPNQVSAVLITITLDVVIMLSTFITFEFLSMSTPSFSLKS